MIKFVEKANLPDSKVKTVICGTEDKTVLDFFFQQGITVIKNSPNGKIDSSVSTHADMCAVHLGKDIILIDKNQIELKSRLENIGMTVYFTQTEIKGEYPSDIKLNFTVLDSFLIGKVKEGDLALLQKTESLKKLNVNQGYCKCSTLVVSENAIITDDESIHKKCLENGIESLFVVKGDIFLDGHNYGFIGGASGKISKDTVVFFGDIEKHRDVERIKAFLLEHGCKYICSDKNKLRDIGGIIPLTV